MHWLKSFYPQHQRKISCSTKLSDTELELNFSVSDYSCAHKGFFHKDYRLNAGLWNFDVCEAFVKRGDCEEYLEVQCSPDEKIFAYHVIRPREKFFIPESLGVKARCELKNNTWHCQLIIKRDDIPGEGVLRGGLFVILGKDDRQYYALEHGENSVPDFHTPHLFKDL